MVGSYARHDVWIFDGEFMKYYVCQACLGAVIQYENDDEFTPIEKRYNFNKHI